MQQSYIGYNARHKNTQKWYLVCSDCKGHLLYSYFSHFAHISGGTCALPHCVVTQGAMSIVQSVLLSNAPNKSSQYQIKVD